METFESLQEAYAAVCKERDELKAKLHETKSEWISVKNRLPEEGTTVLTLSKWKHIGDRSLRTYRGGTKLFSPDGLKVGTDITYWMPLPEPPKGED